MLLALDRLLCSSKTPLPGAAVPSSPHGGFLALQRFLHRRRSSSFSGVGCGWLCRPGIARLLGLLAAVQLVAQFAGRGLGWITEVRGVLRFWPLRRSFRLIAVQAASIWRAIPLSSSLLTALDTTESRYRSSGGMYVSASTVEVGVAL